MTQTEYINKSTLGNTCKGAILPKKNANNYGLEKGTQAVATADNLTATLHETLPVYIPQSFQFMGDLAQQLEHDYPPEKRDKK